MSLPTYSYTLYTQPYLLYPRRLSAYLAEKPLPKTVNLEQINVTFGPTGMNNPPGKPNGSIPMLKIGDSPDDYIRQTVAILEYLEEKHPRGRDMRGSDPEERARVREIVALAEDVTQCMGFYVYNASKLQEGMGLEQAPSAARLAKERMHTMLGKIEEYATRYVREGRWLAGTQEPSLGDVCLYATVEYATAFYGLNLLGGHEVLKTWYGMWNGREAAREREEKIPPVEMTAVAKILSV
jgi:glutathione S-transferase